MAKDTKEKLHDGSYRVTALGRYDGELYPLSKPIEYSARCTRLATAKKSDNRQDTADKWLITINGVSFDYYTGVGHRVKDKPVKPELSGVLCALASDAGAEQSSFEEWCADYGYDSDSRKALALYLECQQSAGELRKAGVYLTDELRDFLSQY